MNKPSLIIKLIILLMLISIVTLLGCISVPIPKEAGSFKVGGNKIIASDEIISHIRPGITTKDEVISLIGKPFGVTIDNKNNITNWSYLYYELYSHSPTNSKHVTLFLNFDKNGVILPDPNGKTRFKTTCIEGKSFTIRD